MPIALAVLLAVLQGAASAPPAPPDLPANQWVKLPGRITNPYVYSQPLYVPTRKQILHWGRVAEGATPRNDVLAFDPAAGAWVPDYPSADPKALPRELGLQAGGGRGVMLPVGTPAPSCVAAGVGFDAKRNQVVYVMKGLMAAYDPQARQWIDLKAETELQGELSLWPDLPYARYERGLRPENDQAGVRLPGGPPVYGVGVGYDPEGDQFILFPHWGGQNPDRRQDTGRMSSHTGTWLYRCQDRRWRRVSSDLSTADPRTHEDALAGPRAAEPPPRAATPLLYAAKHKVLVMFGGLDGLVRTDLRAHGRDPEPGSLNDTWLFNPAVRQWRQIASARRPPPQRLPQLVYDERSGRVLLVTSTSAGKDRRLTLWSLDVEKGEWAQRHEQPFPHEGHDWFGVALDPERRLLVLVQGGATFVFRLDLDKLPSEAAPPWQPPPPQQPQVIPPDDPPWVAKLKALPANQWVHTKPPREADARDWGIAAADPVRGLVFYFGGGHATYQVNDVSVYAVGANRWAFAAGDHNDWVPPIHWDGITMGFRGGPPAGHQRNSYVALDGRMYVFAGGFSRRWDPEAAAQKGTRIAWFYDLNGGGVWRQEKVADVRLEPEEIGTFGRVHLADPAGFIYGFAGHLEPYDGRFFKDEAYFSSYDVRQRRLTVRRIPPPTPGPVGECRPFTLLPDRGQVFFYEYRKDGPERTWLYDLRLNRFTQLQPPRQPGGEPRTVEYLPGHNAVFAVIGKGEQWVYSLNRNAWGRLPLRSDAPMGFTDPYAQVVYVSKYQVLVNVGSRSNGVAVMRPEPLEARWEK